MLYIVYYTLLLLNILLSLTRKNSWLIVLISWLFMFFLFVSNDATAHDHYLSKISFESPEEFSNVELIYDGIQSAVRSIGIENYNYFLAILFCICSIFQFYGLVNITSSFHPILALYLVFLFPQWAVAIRFFLAISISIFSLQFLIKGRWLLYCFFALCATLSHYSMAFALLLAPFAVPHVRNSLLTNKRIENIATFIALSFFLIAIFIYFVAAETAFNVIYSIVGTVFSKTMLSDFDNRISTYFGSKTKLGFLMFLMIYLLNLYMSLKIKATFANRSNEKIKKMIFCNTIINKMLAIIIPFLIFDLVFGRIIALGSVFNLAMMGMIVKKVRPFSHSDRKMMLWLFLGLVALWTIPALLEINSISPNNLVETALQYWGGGKNAL